MMNTDSDAFKDLSEKCLKRAKTDAVLSAYEEKVCIIARFDKGDDIAEAVLYCMGRLKKNLSEADRIIAYVKGFAN